MSPDSNAGRPAVPLARRIFGPPATRAGYWSLGLSAGCVALMLVFIGAIRLYGGITETQRRSMEAGGHFFSLPAVALPLLASATAAIAGGLTALVAILRKKERSLLMLLPILIGAFAALMTIGEFLESRH